MSRKLSIVLAVVGFILLVWWTALFHLQPAPFARSVRPGETIYFVPTPAKVIALTFDDGPNGQATVEILDQLKQHGVQATFFLVGTNAEYYPDIARRIAADGHAVGNHTYRHSRFDLISKTEVLDDIVAGARSVRTVTGVAPQWFRPPFGINGPGMEEACRDLGQAVVGWTAAAGDWNPHAPEEIAEAICAQAAPGVIVLLHDGWDTNHDADRRSTVAALPIMIERLRRAGYRLVTLPELIRCAGRPPAEFANGARLLGMQVLPRVARPGDELTIRYFWDVPPGWNADSPAAFVHIVLDQPPFMFQDDHLIPPRGDVRDRVLNSVVAVPANASPGRYVFQVGLFDRKKPEVRNRIAVRSEYPRRNRGVTLPAPVEIR